MEPAPRFRWARQQLFIAPANVGWDVTSDGRRFLMSVAPATQNTQTPSTVVLNWQADLKH